MVIYIGADHRGFKLKNTLLEKLRSSGYEVVDVGSADYDEEDDYTDVAEAAASRVSAEPENARGILICGSGAGVDITANKFSGVRSALALSPDQVLSARRDDDVNVLSVASDFMDEQGALRSVRAFLETPFSGLPRHKRRIEKILKLERS